MNVPVPIVAAGITVFGGIGIAYFIHWLSKRRESNARRAAACAKFRTSVLCAVSIIPVNHEHWSNAILSSLPEICRTINVAAGEFRLFLSHDICVRFDKEWQELKQHCESDIPKALSRAELFYGGGSPSARDAKEKFHVHINELLSYAKET